MLSLLPLLIGCGMDVNLVKSIDEEVYETDEETDPDTTEPDTTTDPDDVEETPPVEEEQPGEEPEEEPVEEPEEEPVEEADPAPVDDCDDSSDLIYVLSRDDGRLYTFDPSTMDFTSLGRVDCGTSQSPGSMAVDRAGTAYVRYNDESVYSLDLTSMRCSATGYSDRRTGFGSFGMGYATDSATTWRDQLYVANDRSVGVLDPATWTLRELGRMPSQSELTGNADGELWAMLPLERIAELRQLDTTSGATLRTISLPGFPDPSSIDAFAFATWGGDFYLFVRSYGMGESTDVYRVTAAGAMTRVLDDVGFDVVGAGVSTCAPA